MTLRRVLRQLIICSFFFADTQWANRHNMGARDIPFWQLSLDWHNNMIHGAHSVAIIAINYLKLPSRICWPTFGIFQRWPGPPLEYSKGSEFRGALIIAKLFWRQPLEYSKAFSAYSKTIPKVGRRARVCDGI